MSRQLSLACFLLAATSCATNLPREEYELTSSWEGIIHPSHAAAAASRAKDGINCGTHDLRRQESQTRLPPQARRCIEQATRQGMPFRIALVSIAGDRLLQSVYLRAQSDGLFWHADWAIGISEGDVSIRALKCEKAEVEWNPLFFDLDDCTAVDANEWLHSAGTGEVMGTERSDLLP